MKKILQNVLLLSCVPLSLWADPVGVDRARQIAAAYTKDRTAPARMVMQGQRSGSPLRAPLQETDAPLYIFSRGENQGFVIVSGDDCLPPVLGYTDSGDFVESDMPPALLDMLEGYRDLVVAAQEQGAPARAVQYAATGKADIAPLIQTHWHQSAPYNNMSPWRTDGGGRAITGCVATAASQVAYYWRKDLPLVTGYDTPTYGYGDAPVTESVPGGTPYQWELMQLSYGSSYPAEMGNAVARLMYVVGTSTYLTYGSSTGGQISNLVNTFSGQFGMSSTCWYKNDIDQSYWEGIIYDDLALGRPIVYSGVHPTSGGHAIVLDGYRASDNLFHFNFGWGGSGDGYYSLDDETGVNGFSSSQGMTFRITPRTFNYSATIEADTLIQRTSNKIRVKLTNNSTVAYKGIYMFCLLGSSTPSDIAKANGSDETTVVSSGESRTVEFSFPASASGTYTIFVTDANLRILARKSVPSVPSTADLTLKGLSIDAGATAEETLTVDGEEKTLPVEQVYNSTALLTATLHNGAGGTYCEPTVKADLYTYDADAQTFAFTRSYSLSSVGFEVDQTCDARFTLLLLKSGALYQVKMNPTVTTGRTSTLNVETPDSVIYFRVTGADLQLVEQDGTMQRLSGHWNASLFAKMSTDSTVTSYDLTAVEGLTGPLSAANKNALFYVAPETGLAGRNIVCNGECEELELTAGYDFQPLEAFHAEKATLFHGQPAARWNLLVLPFDCAVPQGIMARRIKRLRLANIYECDSVNTVMLGGTPYQCIVGDASADRFTANDVRVGIDTPSTCTDSVRGTFVNLPGSASAYVLGDGDVQYFGASTGQTLPAFTGYLAYTKAVSSLSYTYREKDRVTKNLAVALDAAYNTLMSHAEHMDADANETLAGVIAQGERALTEQPVQSVLQEWINTLNEAVETYVSTVPEEPVEGVDDYTAALANPSFELGSTQGWTMENAATGVASVVVKPSSSLANFMVGADGDYVFYSFSLSNQSADVVQTVTGLEDGMYQLCALFATSEGDTARLVAGQSELRVEASFFGPMYFSEVVLDDIPVSGGSLTLGVRDASSWFKADNFRLYRKGELDAVQQVKATSEPLRVRGGDGCITVTSDRPTSVAVWNTNGVLMSRQTVDGTAVIGGLPRGLYIVNRQKVVVR